MRCGVVAIIGRSNVGKSTLLNRLIGEKVAIISSKPQTTRNRILGILTRKEGQILFLDTPGIHPGRSKLNRRMVRAAYDTLDGADVCFYMMDGGLRRPRPDPDIVDRMVRAGLPIIAVVNKIDRMSRERLISVLDELGREGPFAEIIPMSALTGENTDRLLTLFERFLPEGAPIYPEDQFTDVPLRMLASELIREKILERTREEVPHAVAVALDRYEEDPEKDLVKIYATVYVERDSQKGIVIGKEGSLLKEVGRDARLDIERLTGKRVYLELWVKVMRGWRENDAHLEEFGY